MTMLTNAIPPTEGQHIFICVCNIWTPEESNHFPLKKIWNYNTSFGFQLSYYLTVIFKQLIIFSFQIICHHPFILIVLNRKAVKHKKFVAKFTEDSLVQHNRVA